MTNPSYDPDPANPSAADPYSPSGSSTVPGSYSSDPYAAGGPVVTEDYAASGYVGTTESTQPSTTDVAKGEAAKTKDTAVDAGKSVASTAKGEAANVVAEAKDQASTVVAEAKGQAKSLVTNLTGEVKTQASSQQQRLAGGIHALAAELGSMGAKADKPGPASDLAQQASQRIAAVGHWLENKEPAELLDDVRTFARRKPGLFLGLSALTGVIVGRLGRGAVAANTQLDNPQSSTSGTSYDTTYASGTSTYGGTSSYTDTGTYAESSYAGTTTGAPRSLAEELPTSYEGTPASDYSIATDREAGRGDVTR